MINVAAARVDWLEALTEGDHVFTVRFGIAVAVDWIGFPDALEPALDGARRRPEDPWGTHLIFDDTDGALVGIGGFKGPPCDDTVEIGYAVAPSRQGRGIATRAVSILIERARTAGVTTVSAHTLAGDNASTAVLRKTGFRRVAEVPDADLDAIWRWDLRLAPTRPDTT